MKKLLLLSLVCATFLQGEFDKVGTTTAQFLKIGVGPRAQGMGGSFVAIADDGSATYWNPAGLMSQRNPAVSLFHNPWVLDINHEYLNITIPTGEIGVLGFFYSALTMDEKEVTTIAEQDGTGIYYSTLDMAFGLSYASQMSDRLSYGFSVKYIRLSAYNEVASTFAVDIGSILKTDFYGMSIGMSLSNFGGELRYEGRDLLEDVDTAPEIDGNIHTDVNLVTESWPLPLLIRIGVGLELIGGEDAPVRSDRNSMIVALDATHPNDGPEFVSLGVEYGLHKSVFLRAGYRFNHVHEAMTFGAGIALKVQPFGITKIDYAVIPMGVFDHTSQVSLEFSF